MTNEEAVEWLLSLKNLDICGENRKTAIDKAVTALKAQPCIEDYPTCTECEHYDKEKHYCPRFCQVIKDTLAEAQPCDDTEVIKVSKGAVKARQGRFVIYDVDWLKENFYTTEEKIYGHPKQPCEDCISRQQALDCFEQTNTRHGAKYAIETLPSVTPERPKGKWIFREDMGHQYCCSECGCPKPFVNDYYYKKIIGCPYCLADMSGGGEDEDNVCKDCYYNDGEAHAECVICEKDRSR